MVIRSLVASLLSVLALTPGIATAQVTMRPANRPVVSAENERWYLRGDPITYAGYIFYPAGAAVFFNPNEMVRSGNFRGIPLFTRTTIEPYSVIFVPVANGLLQPYERRRSGDVAGTTGSGAPSFPVERDLEVDTDLLPEAAGSPMLTDRRYELEPFDGHYPYARHAPFTAVPGSAADESWPEPPFERQPMRSALSPQGLNAFYVDYDDARWFKSGAATLVEPAALTRVGEYFGFPVYTNPETGAHTIYVPVLRSTTSLMTPYTRRD